MNNYDIMSNFNNVEGGKYEMPGWMLTERMFNCEGFTSTYYKRLFTGAVNRLRFWK